MGACSWHHAPALLWRWHARVCARPAPFRAQALWPALDVGWDACVHPFWVGLVGPWRRVRSRACPRWARSLRCCCTPALWFALARMVHGHAPALLLDGVCICATCPPASSEGRMVCVPRCARCMCRPGNSLVRCRPPFAAGVGLWCPSPGRDPHSALRSGGGGEALAFWHWACCPLMGVAICNTLSPWPAFPGRPRCP